MDLIFLVFYGLSGAAVGSFLNVCILRIPQGRGVVAGRSHCVSCGHVLGFRDMIPVLSWVLLGGRCRYCGSSVSLQYPAVELLTGASFMLCCFAMGPTTGSALMCLFSCLLITAAFIDGRHMYIPDGIHVLILVLALLSFVAGQTPSPVLRLAGALGAGGFLTLLNLLSKGGVGWGDVKLFAVSGLLIGPGPAMSAILMGYVMAGLWYAVPLMRGKVGRKTRIPMVPFFGPALMICGLWHRELFLWYMGLFR